MEGLEQLISLSTDEKNAINEVFGSIGQLYKKVFDLENEKYLLQMAKPRGFNNRQGEIESELYDIEVKLDELDLDGHDIITEISSDHGEIVVTKRIRNIDAILQKLGTDFQSMRKWMKDKYDI